MQNTAILPMLIISYVLSKSLDRIRIKVLIGEKENMMKQQPKNVNFYNKVLMQGCAYGLHSDKNLLYRVVNSSMPCSYITKMFDTGAMQTTYHRLCLDVDYTGMKMEIVAASSDWDTWSLDGEQISLKSFFQDSSIAQEVKLRVIMELPHLRTVNAADILLNSISGQYFWVYVGIYPMENQNQFTLRGIRLSFPQSSFTQYFPEIYHENQFFDRYIGIFQSIYMDIEAEVCKVVQLLDYESAPDNNVLELAEWLGLNNTDGMFTPAQLRFMIANINLYQGGKGTRAALIRVREMVCGTRPHVIEYFQWATANMPIYRKALYANLYGKEYHEFSVIIDFPEHKPLPPDQLQCLERLIGSYSMLGTKFHLIVLEICCHADMHCYLDINSCLSIPQTARIDDFTLGCVVTVG